MSCFVPPVVLERIARNGTAEQRDWALATLSTDNTLRTVRAISAVRRVSRVRLAAAVEPELPQRSIHSAGGLEQLPGRVVRSEGADESGDPAVDEAYDGLGATFNFYHSVFDRYSIDDQGLPLTATVHYGDHYDNAFWNGTQMVFGDGDGELFVRFTRSLDVIGHELAHGVTENEASLEYLEQSGALNESLSDVFGSLIKQHLLGHSAQEADWLIGADILAPGVQGVALRSMRAPGTAYDDPVLGKDDQPATMSGYVRTTSDNGGVHTNSGIPNHAFYLLATELGGHAWEVAGRIWYEALRDPGLRPAARFAAFARITERVAGQLFDAAVAATVRNAWQEVEVIS